MATLVFGRWTTGISLPNLLAEYRFHARLASTNLEHLGEDAAERSAQLARLVNESVEWAIDRMAGMGYTPGTTIVLAANDVTAALAETIRGRDVARLRLTDAAGRETEPNLIGRAQFDRLDPSPSMRAAGRPEVIALSDDGRSLQLWPASDGAYDLDVLLRVAPTPITAATIDAPSAVTIGDLPSRLLRPVGMYLAALALGNVDGDKADRLERRALREAARILEALRKVPAAKRGRRAHADGFLNRRSLMSGYHPTFDRST
jgi:hypothetical protein